MGSDIYSHPFWPRPVPRISGTAMPTGVHLSDGWSKSSSDWELVLTGAAIMLVGAASLVVSYLIIWVLDGFVPAPLVAILLQALPPGESAQFALWQVAVNLIVFFTFLVVMRATPLASWHAAEHMVVSAIERTGRLDFDIVAQMPRAHRRCGTTLLAGILPALLIGAPLWAVAPMTAVLISVVGWVVREHTGWALQQYFTTKPPSARQLSVAIAAARRLASQRNERLRNLPPAVRIWNRGFPQMVAGVGATIWLLSRIYESLHLLLYRFIASLG